MRVLRSVGWLGWPIGLFAATFCVAGCSSLGGVTRANTARSFVFNFVRGDGSLMYFTLSLIHI